MPVLTGSTYVTFVVALSIPLDEPITAAYMTEPGTGLAGVHYQHTEGTITFEPGQTVKTVQVLVYGLPENDTSPRTFRLRLSPSIGASLVSPVTEATIQVGDPAVNGSYSVVIAAGPQGPKGDPGKDGINGTDGTNGTNGLDGAKGADGVDGKEVALRVQDGFMQWQHVGDDAWENLVDMDSLRGASFSPDAVGLRSERGSYDTQPQGFAFLATDEGLLYFRVGETGWSTGISFGKGEKGDPGTAGAPGADGSKWFSGDGAPLAGIGADGDYYLNTNATTGTGDVYRKSAGAWTSIGNIRGAAGAPGAAGADGSTLLTGTGVPASALGANGDYYIDTDAATNGDLYKKTAGAWGKTTSLMPFADTAEAKAAQSTTKAISPARLREYIQQWGIAADYTVGQTNLNDAVKGSFWSYSNTTANTPKANSYGRGVTLPGGGGYTTQIAVENATGVMSVRYREGDTTGWTAWQTIGGSSGGAQASGSAVSALVSADATNQEITLSEKLSIAVDANSVYRFTLRGIVRVNDTATGIKIGLTGTCGITAASVIASYMTGADTRTNKTIRDKNIAVSFTTSESGSSGTNPLQLDGVVYTSTAGTLGFGIAANVQYEYWALVKGSALTLEKLGTLSA